MKRLSIFLAFLPLMWSLASSAADAPMPDPDKRPVEWKGFETASGQEVANVMYGAAAEMRDAILAANEGEMPNISFNQITKSNNGSWTAFVFKGDYASVACNPPSEHFEIWVYGNIIVSGFSSNIIWSAEFKKVSLPAPTPA